MRLWYVMFNHLTEQLVVRTGVTTSPDRQDLLCDPTQYADDHSWHGTVDLASSHVDFRYFFDGDSDDSNNFMLFLHTLARQPVTANDFADNMYNIYLTWKWHMYFIDPEYLV